jgi:hypothetical protein
MSWPSNNRHTPFCLPLPYLLPFPQLRLNPTRLRPNTAPLQTSIVCLESSTPPWRLQGKFLFSGVSVITPGPSPPPNAPEVQTVHKLEPALENGSADSDKGGSDNIVQVDDLAHGLVYAHSSFANSNCHLCKDLSTCSFISRYTSIERKSLSIDTFPSHRIL